MRMNWSCVLVLRFTNLVDVLQTGVEDVVLAAVAVVTEAVAAVTAEVATAVVSWRHSTK